MYKQLYSEQKKTDDKMSRVEKDEKNRTSNMIKDINILKTLKGEARVEKAGPG